MIIEAISVVLTIVFFVVGVYTTYKKHKDPLTIPNKKISPIIIKMEQKPVLNQDTFDKSMMVMKSCGYKKKESAEVITQIMSEQPSIHCNDLVKEAITRLVRSKI